MCGDRPVAYHDACRNLSGKVSHVSIFNLRLPPSTAALALLLVALLGSQSSHYLALGIHEPKPQAIHGL